MMFRGVGYSKGRLRADEWTYIRDQQWGARPPKPGENEHQILTESWVRGIRAIVETFKENTLESMLRPRSKDLWLRFDPLNSWEQIKRQKSYLSALQGSKEQDIPKASFFQRPSYLNYLPNFIPGSMTQPFTYVLYRSLVTKQSSLGYNLWFN